MSAHPSEYWFYRWLDENDIDDLGKFAGCLDQHIVLADLHDHALEVMNRAVEPAIPRGSLVAGSDLDLSGRDSCRRLECRMEQVNEIFYRAWLYFDQIVVDDSVAALAASPSDSPEWKQALLDSATIAFHVRSLRVDELLAFDARDRRRFCRDCAQQVVDPAGIKDLVATERELSAQFAAEALYEFRDVGSARLVTIKHPLISATGVWEYELESKRRPSKALRRELADDLAHTLLEITVADLATSRDLELPLGTTSPRDRKLLELSAIRQAQASVAFNFELPVLHKIPIDVLLDIRRDDGDLFERFRASLRTAISERLKATPGANPSAIADEIRQDVIEPELARIRGHLRAADRLLARKSGIQLGVGAMLTTCGLLSGLLPITILGVGAIASSVVIPAQRRMETAADVEMSDMFFLWKALGHAA